MFGIQFCKCLYNAHVYRTRFRDNIFKNLKKTPLTVLTILFEKYVQMSRKCFILIFQSDIVTLLSFIEILKIFMTLYESVVP